MQGAAKAFVDLAAKHYPERLQKFWIVGAPKLFSVLWNAIQPFVDPVTKSKVGFYPCVTHVCVEVVSKGQIPHIMWCHDLRNAHTAAVKTHTGSHRAVLLLLHASPFTSSLSSSLEQLVKLHAWLWCLMLQMYRYDVNKQDGLLKQAMEIDFRPECKEWLLAEMAENRTKAAKRSKQYCQKELCSALCKKLPMQRHWGSHEIISSLAADQSILAPIARALEQDQMHEQSAVAVRHHSHAAHASSRAPHSKYAVHPSHRNKFNH
jgi:CRAL/TRIO domain